MEFFEFAYAKNFDAQIESLNQLARPERWNYMSDSSPYPYPILRNYIFYTFKRLYALQSNDNINYICFSEKDCCFNTGLFTPNFEQIYALFISSYPGNDRDWFLKGFFKESSFELQHIRSLPQRAKYFDDISNLIYDTDLDLRINIDHILDDDRNKARIPEQYRYLPNLPMLFKGAALQYAIVRIMENYKAAVPQIFNNRIQFLLPISLGDPQVVDLSLAVEKVGSIYTGRTCLTLDMAYNNARQIAKPESDWLVGT